jgi:uncharacterized protein (DUF1697 family)
VPQYAAFLRGINLGPRRRISGNELRELFDGLGFRGVDTFRTSGNVVFGAVREPLAKMADRIEEGLAASLGYEVAVFLRTADEVRAIAGHQPFARAAVEASKGKLQVVMLSAKPTRRAQKDTLALATDEDVLAFGDRELYWLPSGGTRDSALELKAIAKLLGPTTMRTKGTIDQLAAKYFAA